MSDPGIGSVNIHDARVKHRLFFEKPFAQSIIDGWEYYADKAKKRFPNLWEQLKGRTGVVAKATKALNPMTDNSVINKIMTSKIGKGGLIVAAGVVSFNLIKNAFSDKEANPAIPRQWQRGYDIMDEYLTDFGSPVHLAKTASKIITPYKSSIRRAVKTTTAATTKKNIALYSYSNAIKHHTY